MTKHDSVRDRSRSRSTAEAGPGAPGRTRGSFLALGSTALALLSGGAASDARADDGAPSSANVFVQALVNGRATAPLPDDPRWADVVAALKHQAGSDAALQIAAMRVAKFTNQTQCGRVAFALWQPLTNQAWPQLGGQLNICEDGKPPLQVCAQAPDQLVPVGLRCADGVPAQDTAEVRQAIDAAIAAGSLSADQVRRSLVEAAPGQAPGQTARQRPSQAPASPRTTQ